MAADPEREIVAELKAIKMLIRDTNKLLARLVGQTEKVKEAKQPEERKPRLFANVKGIDERT